MTAASPLHRVLQHRGQIKFGLRVEPAGAAGRRRAQDTGAADDLTESVAHDQVLAIGIETVVVQTEDAVVQFCAHLAGENSVAQALRRLKLFTRPGQRHMQSA